jgi:hypothetical protein
MSLKRMDNLSISLPTAILSSPGQGDYGAYPNWVVWGMRGTIPVIINNYTGTSSGNQDSDSLFLRAARGETRETPPPWTLRQDLEHFSATMAACRALERESDTRNHEAGPKSWRLLPVYHLCFLCTD